MKSFFHRIIPIIIVRWVFFTEGFSQCSNCDSHYPSGMSTISTDTWVNITSCNWVGEYSYCDLNLNYIYQWMTCDDTDWDTQLTLYPSGTYCSSYSWDYDDYACGDQSLVGYKPGYTSVRYLISEYNYCSSAASTCINRHQND